MRRSRAGSDRWDEDWFSLLSEREKIVAVWCWDRCDDVGVMISGPGILARDLDCGIKEAEGVLRSLEEHGYLVRETKTDTLHVRGFMEKSYRGEVLNPKSGFHSGLISQLRQHGLPPNWMGVLHHNNNSGETKLARPPKTAPSPKEKRGPKKESLHLNAGQKALLEELEAAIAQAEKHWAFEWPYKLRQSASYVQAALNAVEHEYGGPGQSLGVLGLVAAIVLACTETEFQDEATKLRLIRPDILCRTNMLPTYLARRERHAMIARTLERALGKDA